MQGINKTGRKQIAQYVTKNIHISATQMLNYIHNDHSQNTDDNVQAMGEE